MRVSGSFTQNEDSFRGALIVSLLALIGSSAVADEPTLDHQQVECAVPEKNTRICAHVLDDGEVKRVRVYFRSQNRDAYYWSDMSFDGIRFCATLPVAKGNVQHIDYYVWAVDDEFQTTRTRAHKISMLESSRCAYPVVDEDRDRVANLVVHATSEKQGRKLEDFEERGVVRFVPAKKR